MKRYRLVFRGIRNTYYSVDTRSNKRESLGTAEPAEARRLLAVKNEAVHHAEMNLQIAQVYLQHSDPTLASRTWQDVMEEVSSLKSGSTRERYQFAIQDSAFDLIRNRKLLETSSEHFLSVLRAGTVSTNVYLRRFHNFAIGMHWLPWLVLPRLQWPAVCHKDKRAVTFEEHQRIIAREKNPEMNAYLRLLWHIGGSQTDVTVLTGENIDWSHRTAFFALQVQDWSRDGREIGKWNWKKFNRDRQDSQDWEKSVPSVILSILLIPVQILCLFPHSFASVASFARHFPLRPAFPFSQFRCSLATGAKFAK